MLIAEEQQSLSTIENNIASEISSLEYWGDLDLSFDEFELIRDKLKELLSNRSGIEFIYRNYPHIMTTYMVFFVRYKYDVNFWGALGADLGTTLQQFQQAELGDCAKRMFSKYNMDYSDAKDEARVNIAPIIYEACLPPESSLADLFYVLSYDSYNVFDPQLIIDELVEMRSYVIRKPMLRFLKRFKNERAVDFVLEVRDAMISTEQNTARISRYSNNYSEWKEQYKTKDAIRNRKSQDFQTKPYLFFDNGKKGLCIVLPRTILENEWIFETTWIVKGKHGFEKTIHCNVMGDDGERYTETLYVPVSPDDKYTVSLEDSEHLDDKMLKTWEIDGVNCDRILTFNSNGRLINANYLLSPYGILIIPDTVSIVKANHLDFTEQYYPTVGDGYRVVSAVPLGNDSSLVFSFNGLETTIAVKPQISLKLEGKTLFSLDSVGVNSGVYTEIPSLSINVEGTNGTSGLEIRLAGQTYPVSLSEEGTGVFELKKIFKSVVKNYGTYSVRLYRLGHFVKQVEFSYVPKIKSNYSPLVNWTSLKDRKEKSFFKFHKLDNWQMEFSNCVVYGDDEYYKVECPSNEANIRFSLKASSDNFAFTCEMNLPVKPFEISLVDNEGVEIDNITDKCVKYGLEELLENDIWLSVNVFGEYLDYHYSLQIVSANGIEQEIPVLLTQSGCGNINLNTCYDTLRNCPLPAQFVLVCDANEDSAVPLITVSEKMLLDRRPRYLNKENVGYFILDIADDGKDIDVVRFGFGMKEYHIPYSESKLTKSGESRAYKYHGVIPEGIYIVSGNNEQSVFEFEEDEIAELKAGNNLICVSCMPREKKSVTTTKEWLDYFVRVVINSEASEDICEKDPIKWIKSPRFLTSFEVSRFDDNDIEKLVALAYIVNSKVVTSKKNTIRECMKFISMNLLHRGDRYRILSLLIELKCPQEVFDICMEEYSLLLIYKKDVDIKSIASQIEGYSTELSMLLMMSANASIRECIWREKYRELIGKDAIRNLMHVSLSDDPSVVADEQKKFLREDSSSKVKIHLSDEISGNQEVIQSMIVLNKRYEPYFDITKKPDFGVYFARIRYVDQLVNWFKSTHDKQCEMDSKKREIFDSVVNSHHLEILKAFDALSTDSELGDITKEYFRTVNLRCDNLTHVSSRAGYPLYFALQGLAAYLAKLPAEREDLDAYRSIGIKFMAMATVVAPRLSQRDVLMAATYIYLKRKEEKLCR